MMKKLLILFVIVLSFGFTSSAFATTCIESISCLPTTSPLQVWQIFDIQVGTGTTLIMMALVLGAIEMAIYMRTRSLAMLAVLGIYTIAAFGSMLLSPYISSQYHIAEYVIILAVASVFVMMILKLVKE